MVNVIVLWNTIYMDAALNRLRAEGHEVRDEGVARLSPLGFEHINMLGRYAFTLPEPVARGELRPLRDPNSASDDADSGEVGRPFRLMSAGVALVHKSRMNRTISVS